jgi:gluconokinase
VVVVIMGAAGAGKTTIGRALATQLGWSFVDGDDLHPQENVRKMHAGIGLTDADRAPWLAALHAVIAQAIDRREGVVLACSALKRRYREILRGDCRNVRFVHLRAPEPELLRRLTTRREHFAGPNLIGSQLATLEEPALDERQAIIVDATAPPARILDTIREQFGL